MSCLIDCLHRHTTRERSITNQGNNVVVLALLVAGDGHAQRRRKRSGSVARAKRVVFRLVAAQKAADASILFDGRQLLATSGKNLMSISLVAHVPNQAVVRRVERVM